MFGKQVAFKIPLSPKKFEHKFSTSKSILSEESKDHFPQFSKSDFEESQSNTLSSKSAVKQL